jgi:predicted alpha/beta-fold hydrolase
MDLLTEKELKKNYPLHSVGFSLGKNTVCNFIGNYLKIFKKKNHFTNYKIIKLI